MDDFATMTIGEFIDKAASGEPVPGGGGVAALAGALGAAMAAMAANFTAGKPKYAEHDALMRRTLGALSPIIDGLRRAVDEDARAFSSISAAYALPRDGEEEKARRKVAIDAALADAMAVPLSVAGRCLEAARLLPRLAETGNANLLSDVEVAAIMVEAAARCARVNVLANSRSLTGEAARAAEAEAELTVAEISNLAAETLDNVFLRRR